MPTDFNDLLNPLGSVRHNNIGSRRVSDRTFDHSANNPAMGMINDMIESGNYLPEDVGDLYDAAAQWEIDQAKYIQQLQVQEYLSDPLYNLQRQRAAGINPDLAASAGSSASSSGASAAPAFPNQNSPIGNTDNYRRADLALQGAQLAVNAIDGLTTSFVALSNGIQGWQSFPYQQAILQSNASTAASQSRLADANAQSAHLKLYSDRMNLVGNLSDYFTQEMFEGDGLFASNLFKLSGFDETADAWLLDAIKEYHHNPHYKSKVEQARANAIKQRIDADKWSSDAYAMLITSQMAAETANNTLMRVESEIQTSLLQYLEANGFYQRQADLQISGQNVEADNQRTQLKSNQATRSSADTVIASNNLDQEKIKFAHQQLEQDVKAFVNGLSQIKENINYAQQQIDAIYEDAERKDRYITPEEQQMIKAHQATIQQLHTLGAQRVTSSYQMFEKTAQRAFTRDLMLNRRGQTRNVAGKSNEFTLMNNLWYGYFKGDYSDAQLTEQYMGHLSNLLSSALN